MAVLHTVVVGSDGSPPSTAAVAWTLDRVPAGGTIHLVHSADTNTVPPTDWDEPGEHAALWSDRHAANQDLEHLNRVHRCAVTSHVVSSHDPAAALLTAAEELGADSIVVGPHSAPHNKWTIGSVTRRLLQHSPVPIVIPKDAHVSLPSGNGQRRVVACVGYGDVSEMAGMWAGAYAAERGLPLSLLHAVAHRPVFPVSSPSEMLASYLGSDVVKQWAAEDLAEIKLRLEHLHPAITIDTHLAVGSAVSSIVDSTKHAELVVLGKRDSNAALRTMISPRLHWLISQSTSAIAVVPASCSTSQ